MNEQTTKAPTFPKAILKDREIPSDCLKKENRTFTENEEDRVDLLLRTHFVGFYSTVEGSNTLPNSPIIDKREKRKQPNRFVRKLE